MAWTSDLRFFSGYDESDPRPPALRTLDLARAAPVRATTGSGRALARHAGSRPDGRRADDVHQGLVRRLFGAVDATPLLVGARSLKTGQEIERIRLANEIAAAAMEHVRGLIRPGMTESAGRRRVAGFVHGEGTGWGGRSSSPSVLARLAGPGIRTFTATSTGR